MCTFFLAQSTEILNSELFYLRIILWVGVCFFTGRSVGKTIDIQHREPEGKPNFISIPDRKKWMYHFRFFTGNEVVKEGVITQIVGYLFSGLELLVFSLAVYLNWTRNIILIADWIVILFAATVSMGVLLPMQIRYNRHMQSAYDCDWITYLQENLTLYPKRRCVVVSQIDSSTYEITLGKLGRRKHLAKTTVRVAVGARMFAVHSNEQGSPFWTIKSH